MQPTSLDFRNGDNSSTPWIPEQVGPRNRDNDLNVGIYDHLDDLIPPLEQTLKDDYEQYSESITWHEEPIKAVQPQPARPGLLPRASSIGRRLSFITDEGIPPEVSPSKRGPVSWNDLPRKGQLTLLTLARLSEPLAQTSLQAYMYYQLKSFNPALPASTIASQAGLLQGSFTAAQCVTAVFWGRAADADWGGRKKVLLVGLLGTCISCVGFGFSRSFVQAAVFRTLGGVLNGNMGVLKTMISEIVKEKKYQSRAFLLLPMCFNIGVIIGPILGGLLADPIASYPKLFGENSTYGGKEGVWWMKHWPYALPNLLSAMFLFSAAVGVFLGLEETLDTLRDQPDLGLSIRHAITGFFRHLFRRASHKYSLLGQSEVSSPFRSSAIETYDLESPTAKHSATTSLTPKRSRERRKLPLRRIWTRNVVLTFICHATLSFHVSTFQNLWYIFLSAPRHDSSDQKLPFWFTGGLGMPPRTIGIAMAVLGSIGITLQLLVYPTVNQRLGTLKSYRYFLLCFPLAYCLAPYLAVVPSTSPPPTQASGALVWLALGGVLFIQVVARTFALPANTILVNNCSPHPSVLGTIHGIAQSAGSASRTAGPMLGGWLFGRGLSKGIIGGVWWGLAGVAVCGWIVSGLVYEGSGHEIWLEGEKEAEEEEEVEEVSE